MELLKRQALIYFRNVLTRLFGRSSIKHKSFQAFEVS